MAKRYLSIWFPHLLTDWLASRQPGLRQVPFIVSVKEHGRMVITATNVEAEKQGILIGMAVVDARAIIPGLQVVEDIPGKPHQLLNAIGEWCIRYTPLVSIDMPNGLILDVSGCPHLWGGELEYLTAIAAKLKARGYGTRMAIADTIGMAWANARFGQTNPVIEPGGNLDALLPLPPAALRLEPVLLERLQKLGFYKTGSFINISRSALRRRFGQELLRRLDQAIGLEIEVVTPLQPIAPYEERLPCLEPIRTATGIEIALERLLETLCKRLEQEGKGMRTAILKCYRVDGKVVQIEIGTNRASRHIRHLFKLFELKIATIEPDLGIELFVMEAPKVEDLSPEQEALWINNDFGLDDQGLAELLDRLAGKVGADAIHRYLPQEHYWPERSIKSSLSLLEKPSTEWRTEALRPTYLLAKPELIEVTVRIPDYPPMLFIYKTKLHHVKRADGPERIEREWWIEAGEHRDYYQLEDQEGKRYWVFRSGHYSSDQEVQWFLHGFFA